ncbi:uridine cytidine kinase I, putative [Entamoeba invadens IP1]|uniref:Uridine cytidine kinase I, putative n=1 Tax=Entamoeba invadens IP1 TaxID=370355 RepID=A0A0A1UF79_ENTIV|nr:uridine cytidine kinase I, putative [Entamoeba invadens IP1]ELP95138.1 uridine cytidine kinase I, putative [Entamoeba invadens IP1]|eukprot:XP_004261909.1 uridine cytidine kinase I, putative [Entamoeba invadens IP1]
MTSIWFKGQTTTLAFPVKCSDVVEKLKIENVPSQVVGLKVNGIAQTLSSYILTPECEVAPCYIDSVEGKNMCRRTEAFLLRLALHKTFPSTRMAVIAEFGDGTKYSLDPLLTPEELQIVYKEYEALHHRVLTPLRMSFNSCKQFFTETKQLHSLSLVCSLNNPFYECISLDKFYTLTLSQPFVSDPSVFKQKALLRLEGATVFLDYPDFMVTDSYTMEQNPIPTCQLYNNLDVGEVNKTITQRTYDENVLEAENYHTRQLAKLIDKVEEKDTQLILIAGPSSSGKTTFAHKVSLALEGIGHKPLVMSVDNYYVNKDKCPLDENGQRDWERIDALRLDLINQHLCDLMDGKEIKIPHFDFATSTETVGKGTSASLARGGIIIMEGIHCLDERMTQKVPHEKKVKVFIAPVSHSVCLTDDVVLDNNFLRIQRRMVRDMLFRGYPVERTLEVWDNVAGAEKIWIYPYIKEADFVYTTFMAYEVNLLVTFSQCLLRAVNPNDPLYGFAQSYLRLLSFYLPMDSVGFAPNSVLREFCGGGVFNCH